MTNRIKLTEEHYAKLKRFYFGELVPTIKENQKIVNMMKTFYDLESNTMYPERSMDKLNQKIKEITGKDIKNII